MLDHDRLVQVATRPCFVCKEGGVIAVPYRGYDRWQAGALIQDALPDVSVEAREQLITGTHPVCWERLFGAGDEPDRPTPAAAALVEIGELRERLG